MSFLYVVQGISGMARMKVVLTAGVYTAAAGMIHEALNGYSITLSGSVHSETAAVIFESHRQFTENQFVRARTWQEVVDSGKKNIISTPQNPFRPKFYDATIMARQLSTSALDLRFFRQGVRLTPSLTRFAAHSIKAPYFHSP